MRDSIKWVANRMPKSDDRQLSIMSLGNVAKARFFHSSFPQYSITPLARLDGMAKYLGLGDLFVKDESFRFGLNAFKVLGGSFAMARYIAKEMGRDVSDLRLPDQRGIPPGVRPRHLLHRHGRQPRPGRGLGGSQAGPEGSGPHAQGLQPGPV